MKNLIRAAAVAAVRGTEFSVAAGPAGVSRVEVKGEKGALAVLGPNRETASEVGGARDARDRR